jgi:hypothetical protein
MGVKVKPGGMFVTAFWRPFVVQETADARKVVVGKRPQIVYKQDVYSMAILFAELLEPAHPIFENMSIYTIMYKVRVTPAVHAGVCV